jgi:glyoxylase-like metal-dependent hydrolase (beta-lactamase superfamily II)/rhodanese-related sulfurtransferase
MIFEQLNPGACKTYLVASESTREALLVDPVLPHLELYLSELAKRGLTLRFVVDTHVHADHLSACAALRDRTNAEYVMHQNATVKCVSRKLRDGDTLRVGDVAVTALHTPGHTKDSMSLLLEGRILTGDFLFIGEGGAGRTDLFGGDAGDHWDALQRLANLPDATVVFPGHDYHCKQSSTLGDERKHNARLARRARTEYIQWLSQFQAGPSAWMTDVVKANVQCTRDPNAVAIPQENNTCEMKPAAAAGGGAVRTISPEQLADLISTKRPDLILDVRNPDEYTGELGHVAGSILIPLGELQRRIPEIAAYADKSVITICKMGGRSSQAASVLGNAGFRNVQSMAGGMVRWRALQYPVER